MALKRNKWRRHDARGEKRMARCGWGWGNSNKKTTGSSARQQLSAAFWVGGSKRLWLLAQRDATRSANRAHSKSLCRLSTRSNKDFISRLFDVALFSLPLYLFLRRHRHHSWSCHAQLPIFIRLTINNYRKELNVRVHSERLEEGRQFSCWSSLILTARCVLKVLIYHSNELLRTTHSAGKKRQAQKLSENVADKLCLFFSVDVSLTSPLLMDMDIGPSARTRSETYKKKHSENETCVWYTYNIFYFTFHFIAIALLLPCSPCVARAVALSVDVNIHELEKRREKEML